MYLRLLWSQIRSTCLFRYQYFGEHEAARQTEDRIAGIFANASHENEHRDPGEYGALDRWAKRHVVFPM